MVALLSKREAKQISGIKVHLAAYPAFEFVKSLRFLFSDAIKKGLLNEKLLNEAVILQGKIIETELHIFAGFESMIFDFANLNLLDTTVLIHQDIADEDIKLFAWKNVLYQTLLSSVSSDYLDLIHSNINAKIPSDVANKLYYHSHLSEELLAKMTGKAKNTIAKQKSRHKPPRQEMSISLFEQVVGEADDR